MPINQSQENRRESFVSYQNTSLLINGKWRASTSNKTIDVVNPATEEKIGTVACAIPAAPESMYCSPQAISPRSKPTWTVKSHWRSGGCLRLLR